MKNYFETNQSLNEANAFISFIICRALSHPAALNALFLDDDYPHVFGEIGLEDLYLNFHEKVDEQARLEQEKSEQQSLTFMTSAAKIEIAEAIFSRDYKSAVEAHLSSYLDFNAVIPPDSSLAGRNTYNLQKLLGLSDTETAVFLFFVHYDDHPTLEKVIKKCPTPVTPQKRMFYLSVLTGLELQEINSILDQSSRLFSLGLLEVNSSIRGIHTEEHIPKFCVPQAIKYRIHKPQQNVLNVIDYTYAEPPESDLTIEDFSFIEDHQLLVNAIKNAVNNGECGFNILIHGEPGKGKTTFAQTLFKAAGITAKMVAWEDDDKRSLDGERRLQFFNMVQHSLKARGEWGLIFDEASDILATVPSLFNRPTPVSKNHINASLENNKLPVIYICNDIDYFDRATLDRFLFKLEMPAMTEDHRKKALKKSVESKLGTSVKPEWIEKHALNAHLTPRHIDNAFRMASLAFNSENDACSLERVDHIIDNYQSYLPKSPDIYKLNEDYDVQFVNCGADAKTLVERFGQATNMRALFHGLSGTGKSAFARYLLKSAGIKYKAFSASDLISKYLGETEKKISNMFKDASKGGFALVLDEIDSFLPQRDKAKYHWERTMVNQFIEELEKFEGIFIATTNFENLLDPAILRRFYSKLQFSALTAKQALLLFSSTSDRLNLTNDVKESDIYANMARLQLLTPGDFNAINNRVEWLGITTASGYLFELKNEVSHKQVNASPEQQHISSIAH